MRGSTAARWRSPVRLHDRESAPGTSRLDKIQAGEVRLYDLQHTCATLLLLADVPAKVVSECLGHSTITLPMNTYSHVLPTMQKKAAHDLGKILGKQIVDKKAAGG